MADYGQLDCAFMIEAFDAWGDFHSRTALGMFYYIRGSVENGEYLLEWDYANSARPKPMPKDKFACKRKKAKTLNFSIAYGKPAYNLRQVWGVTADEAEGMLQAWYDFQPEVEMWQK